MTFWDIYVLIVLGVIPVVAYQIGNVKWRTWEARQIWGDILSSSRG